MHSRSPRWRGWMCDEWRRVDMIANIGEAGVLALAFGVAAASCAAWRWARPVIATWRRGSGRQQRPRDFAHISRLAVVGELTAVIAHEINQPLGAILSNADAGEMLLDRIARDPAAGGLDELSRILADIRRDALRASGVIRHVRTLAGRRELTLDQVDANSLAAGTVRLLESDMQRRRIAVDVAPLEDGATLRGDRAHLEQVLINLLLNAMDAMEAQAASGAAPPIVLGVARTGHGAIEFRVVDHGQGIPAEHLNKLFHSFYSSKPHGMGLGLSIARSIVEAHGGWIRAENNAGPGATFRVTFPPYAE